MSLPSHTPGGTGFHVTIDSESCNRRAFWCLNGEMLTVGRMTRGTRAARPGTPGRLRGKRYTDDREVDLEFMFDGAHDVTGDANADREAGLNDTLLWFEENIVYAVGDARSRLAVEVEGKGGQTWSGLLQVVEFERGVGLDACMAVLSVAIPAGRLTPDA